MKKLFFLPIIGLFVLQVSCNKKVEESTETKVDSTQVSQDSTAVTTSEEYSKQLTYDKFSFNLVAKNGELTITPVGFANDNTPVVKKITGKITNAEVSDINGDNSPELMVYLSEGADENGSVIGYSSNAGKSISEISVPVLDDKNKEGYKGHDEFAMVENNLVQRFPIFDASGNKTGKTRQLQYKLKEGEAARQLVVDKVVEY